MAGGLVGVVDVPRATVTPRGGADEFFPCLLGVVVAKGVTPGGWFVGRGFLVVIGHVQRTSGPLLLHLLFQWRVAAEAEKDKTARKGIQISVPVLHQQCLRLWLRFDEMVDSPHYSGNASCHINFPRKFPSCRGCG